MIEAGALGSETEAAAVFIVAQTLGLRAGAVLNVVWNKEREKAGLDKRSDLNMDHAILTVTGAIRRLIRARRNVGQ